jgi:hypothetical protein
MNANASNPKSSTHPWLDVLPCPGDAMERVASQPVCHPNWIVPTLLVSAIFALSVSGSRPAIGQNQALYQWQIQQLAQLASIGINTLFGLIWSASVLWAMARFIFKTRVPFFKAVEVVGLSGVIVALSALTSLLLGLATGHSGLSLVPNEVSKNSTTFPQLLSVHLFNLWIVIVLAIGLSKLTKTDWKECILWTFSYWFVLRLLFA